MIVIRFLLRILFLPINLILLTGTAIIELMMDCDWQYWKVHNQGLLNALPWSSYKKASE